MIERAMPGEIEQRLRCEVGGTILAGEKSVVIELPLVQTGGSALNGFVDVGVKFGRLAGADQRTKIERRRQVRAGEPRRRMTEPQRLHNFQIGIEKARKELALDDEADVGSASLLAILEAFLDLLFKFGPIGE